MKFSMDPGHIITLLEKPTRDVWSFVYQIRDEAEVSDIADALQASTNPFTRCLLCYILDLRFRVEFFEKGTSDIKQALPALIEALSDPEEDVRDAAIDTLGHIGDPVAGPALLQLYQQEGDHSRLRLALVWALGACHYVPALPTLIEALSSSDSALRASAARGIRYLKAQEAKEPLQQSLTQEMDSGTKQVMQETLQELEHPSTREAQIGTLIAQLRSKDVETRESAATVLGDFVDQRVLVSLLALLHDEQSRVRQSALESLAGFGMTRDTDWFVRANRAQVQRSLIQALTDQEGGVRAAAAEALGRGDWADEQAVEPLIRAIQDQDTEARRNAVEALGYLKDERVVEPLLTIFLNDSHLEIRAYAAQGLGQWKDSRAVNTLIRALKDERSQVRQQAAEMLMWLKDERATDALIQALGDPNAEVRTLAIEALWRLCTGKGDDLSQDTQEKLRQSLIQALQDEESEVREGASKILEWLG